MTRRNPGEWMRHPAEDLLARRSRWLTHAISVLALAALAILATFSLTAHAAASDANAPDADACKLVQEANAEQLIVPADNETDTDTVIDRSSSHPAPGKSNCFWQTHKSGAASNTPPDATLSLDFYHFVDAAHAQANTRDLGVPPIPPLFITTDDSADRIFRISGNEIAALHGSDVAVVHAETPATISNHPSWSARLEALALGAAGAHVHASANANSNAGVGASTGETTAWHPAAHAAPAVGVTLALPLHVLWALIRWRFLMPPVLIALILASAVFLKGLRRHFGWLIPLAVVLTVVNIIFGPYLGVLLIYRMGEQGQAAVTSTYGTSTRYNNHRVIGYNVLLRTADGKVVETTFEDDDLNIYAPHNSAFYPHEGDEFTVRYVAGFPGDFVIVSDDDSPWAKRMRCRVLTRDAFAAQEKQRFAPDSAAFRDAAKAADQALQAAGCDVNQ
ncbi:MULTISPECIES: hypothetical protein [Paraburkholderia]|uniref:hypothetical protein n=1 Tax=Paraburkholderia TaxID=1822464 RepID=UPI0022523D76|nr:MULTISPECIES: hypothetical protein [Paraburkholderia]MCX4163357.1 hypothetical protein [Paraburkholderia megapolitana]MDN7158852.1 hypothetical protein [Paraburkholderia sp. CHISQ3]MDQ6495899.1 hypothetical protein [Paraburkholderia megapolitana]